MPAALGAVAPRNASFGPLAGSPVFGPAGFGTPDALDAGSLASAGPAVDGPAFLETDRALAAPGIGPVFSAADTKPHRAAPLGAQAMALAILDASPLDVSMGHWGRLPDR